MKIKELTFFRFVAASIVVIFHYGRDATGFRGVLISGPEMVTFFFVLSGFVMGIAYLEKELKSSSYWWARISRIMPIYLVALALVIAGYIVQGESIEFTPLVLNATLMQSWFSPYPTSLNTPGWSLSVEGFFYLSFPLILIIIKKCSISGWSMASYSLVLWLLTQAITTSALSLGYYDGSHSLSHDLIFYFPLTHFCSFLLGISGSLLLSKMRNLNINSGMSMVWFGLTIVIIVFTLNNKTMISSVVGLTFAYGSSFLAPLFLCFILSIALNQSKVIKFFSMPLLVLLGEASYSLYILQKPIYAIYDKYISTVIGLQPLLDFFAFYLLLTIISIFVFTLFEKPVNKYLRYSLPRFISTKFTRVSSVGSKREHRK